MKKILDMLTEQMQDAFVAAGYDGALGKVSISNRPDLCEYQCNGAMAGAKQYRKAPIMIARKRLFWCLVLRCGERCCQSFL